MGGFCPEVTGDTRRSSSTRECLILRALQSLTLCETPLPLRDLTVEITEMSDIAEERSEEEFRSCLLRWRALLTKQVASGGTWGLQQEQISPTTEANARAMWSARENTT